MDCAFPAYGPDGKETLCASVEPLRQFRNPSVIQAFKVNTLSVTYALRLLPFVLHGKLKGNQLHGWVTIFCI